MKETRDIICTSCPLGCQMKAMIEDGKVTSVEGHTCKKGEKYAVDECTNPTRILTTTVKVNGGALPVAPVKSESPLPKGMLMKSMDVINHASVTAPVNIGDIIIKDLLGTGINIISTRSIPSSSRV